MASGKSDAQYIERAVKSFFSQTPGATFCFWVQGSALVAAGG